MKPRVPKNPQLIRDRLNDLIRNIPRELLENVGDLTPRQDLSKDLKTEWRRVANGVKGVEDWGSGEVYYLVVLGGLVGDKKVLKEAAWVAIERAEGWGAKTAVAMVSYARARVTPPTLFEQFVKTIITPPTSGALTPHLCHLAAASLTAVSHNFHYLGVYPFLAITSVAKLTAHTDYPHVLKTYQLTSTQLRLPAAIVYFQKLLDKVNRVPIQDRVTSAKFVSVLVRSAQWCFHDETHGLIKQIIHCLVARDPRVIRDSPVKVQLQIVGKVRRWISEDTFLAILKQLPVEKTFDFVRANYKLIRTPAAASEILLIMGYNTVNGWKGMAQLATLMNAMPLENLKNVEWTRFVETMQEYSMRTGILKRRPTSEQALQVLTNVPVAVLQDCPFIIPVLDPGGTPAALDILSSAEVVYLPVMLSEAVRSLRPSKARVWGRLFNVAEFTADPKGVVERAIQYVNLNVFNGGQLAGLVQVAMLYGVEVGAGVLKAVKKKLSAEGLGGTKGFTTDHLRTLLDINDPGIVKALYEASIPNITRGSAEAFLPYLTILYKHSLLRVLEGKIESVASPDILPTVATLLTDTGTLQSGGYSSYQSYARYLYHTHTFDSLAVAYAVSTILGPGHTLHYLDCVEAGDEEACAVAVYELSEAAPFAINRLFENNIGEMPGILFDKLARIV